MYSQDVLLSLSFLIPFLKAVAEVAITITDINDNVPEFLHMVHKATVPEDIANNTFVSVVREDTHLYQYL